MSRLGDIQRELDARLTAINDRLSNGCHTHADREGSAPPTLSSADLDAIRDLKLQVAGFAPDSQLPSSTDEVDADLRSDMLAVAEIAKAKSMPIGCATLTVVEKGVCVEQKRLPFAATSVFQDGIPTDRSNEVREIAMKVAQSAAYFKRRRGISCFDGIAILWAYVDSVYDLDSNRMAVEYAYNAFSSPTKQGSRLAALCFSPRIMDLVVVGHEFTHSVSHDIIGWGGYYAGETGAINESCSDIFAKFDEFAWEGIDESDSKRWQVSTLRDMAHPSLMKAGVWKMPDYYLEPPDEDNPQSGWMTAKTPNAGNDFGGVHINNGVLTRLCFLLCEGEDFTRKDGVLFSVSPIGFGRTEELLSRTFLTGGYLTEKPSVYDVYQALVLAARDLSFTIAESQSVQAACEAVNIIPSTVQNQRGGAQVMIHEKRSLRGLGDDVAEAVVRAYSDEFGLSIPGCGYVCVDQGTSSSERGTERTIKYRQTFNGLPVFGATAVARVDGTSEVTFMNSGFSQRLGCARAIGTIDSAAAAEIGRKDSGGLDTLACEQVVFDPQLFDGEGSPTVAWHVTSGLSGSAVSHRLIDSVTGRILFSAPLQIA